MLMAMSFKSKSAYYNFRIIYFSLFSLQKYQAKICQNQLVFPSTFQFSAPLSVSVVIFVLMYPILFGVSSFKATKICSFATFFTYSCGIYIYNLYLNTDFKFFFCSVQQQQQYYRTYWQNVKHIKRTKEEKSGNLLNYLYLLSLHAQCEKLFN